MVNQNEQEALKKFQNAKNKEHEKTKELGEDFTQVKQRTL
jgi:hypothetical protein